MEQRNAGTVGDRVVGSDGAEIGTVVATGSGYLIVGAGRFLPNDYYVPTLAVRDRTDGVVTLNVTSEEALHMGWDQPPAPDAIP